MAPIGFLILGLLMLIFNDFAHSDHGFGCNSTSAVANFTSRFAMVQHQVRGVFTVVDDCSFRVSDFDMLSGGSDVRWWGSSGDDFQSLLTGSVISDSALNHTYRNDSFIVRLRDNATWDQIKVVAVWDIPSASDFGHVLLSNQSADSEVNSSKLQPPLSVLDNCIVLSDTFRLWWSFNNGDDYIDIALEAAIPMENYMSFGWADPNASGSLMVGSDVVITGFDSDQMPFAHDYFITQMTECTKNEDGTVQGVCPDMAYNSSSSSTGLVNDTSLIYGHRSDGVSFIRYRRPLQSNDEKYDLKIDPELNMSVIWATGPIKPPDSLQPSYLPQNHGTNFGYLRLNISERRNDCLGPIDAADKEDQDLVIADKKEPLIVSSGPALRYPNPPNPSKVLYINKKEAPLLRVERGVPVKFSIQAGHDVAFYITSDPIGGNATLRNGSETIYFGGPEAEGVPASPTELIWAPDRNTPDLVYYQSLFTPKMGWKVQVVDGGLPDMYNNSVSLDDQQVMFFWTLSENSISIAARGEKKSGYLAIGFGRGMVNSYVYVGYVDESGQGKVSTYWIDSRDASGIHPTQENLTYVRCKSENGIITLEFTRPLNAGCDVKGKPECNNIIDPSTPLRVIWAMGALWSSTDGLTLRNMHFMTSKRPMSVLLMRGSAEAEEDLRPVLAVHGFMMFLAWGILLPGGILAARYLKHVKDDSWFRIHVYLQYSGLTIVFLGFLFAVAELRGLVFDSFHVKLGLLAIFLAASQPLNAYFRPKKPAIGEATSSKRIIWEYAHIITGRCGMVVGVAAVFSGMKHLGDRYRDGNVHGLSWALIVWFLLAVLFVVYMEYRDKNRKRGTVLFGRSNWVLGDDDDEEEEDADLLSSRRGIEKVTESNGRMEVQLEPLSLSR